MFGARISLLIGLVGITASLFLGLLLGGLAGYYGGWVDSVIQRVIEILRSFPELPLWMALSAVLPVRWSPILIFFGITLILALPFLGLGLRPPITSWGVLLNEAQNMNVVALYPWLILPVAPVIIVILAFNFFGDGLRDAADPYK